MIELLASLLSLLLSAVYGTCAATEAQEHTPTTPATIDEQISTAQQNIHNQRGNKTLNTKTLVKSNPTSHTRRQNGIYHLHHQTKHHPERTLDVINLVAVV